MTATLQGTELAETEFAGVIYSDRGTLHLGYSAGGRSEHLTCRVSGLWPPALLQWVGHGQLSPNFLLLVSILVASDDLLLL